MTIDFSRIPLMILIWNYLKHSLNNSDRNCIGIHVCFLFFSDWKTSEYEFANGEEFEVPWGRKGGIMHSSCSTPEPNKMVCISEEREKGWNIIDESSFSTVREYPIFSKLF